MSKKEHFIKKLLEFEEDLIKDLIHKDRLYGDQDKLFNYRPKWKNNETIIEFIKDTLVFLELSNSDSATKASIGTLLVYVSDIPLKDIEKILDDSKDQAKRLINFKKNKEIN